MESRQLDIKESPLIRSILIAISFNSWLVLDLDNTIIENPCELGSDPWFCELAKLACHIMPNHLDATAAVIALYNEVQHHLRAKAVEDNIAFIIKALRKIGIPVIGLTARGFVLKDATERQLAEAGIELTAIIFCDGKDKGVCFTQYLSQCAGFPDNIVAADDKEKHLIALGIAMSKLNIGFKGIRYSHLDEKVKNIDMDKAHAQLAQIHHRLHSSTQAIILRLGLMQGVNECSETNSAYFIEHTVNRSSISVSSSRIPPMVKVQKHNEESTKTTTYRRR